MCADRERRCKFCGARNYIYFIPRCCEAKILSEEWKSMYQQYRICSDYQNRWKLVGIGGCSLSRVIFLGEQQASRFVPRGKILVDWFIERYLETIRCTDNLPDWYIFLKQFTCRKDSLLPVVYALNYSKRSLIRRFRLDAVEEAIVKREYRIKDMENRNKIIYLYLLVRFGNENENSFFSRRMMPRDIYRLIATFF